MLIWFLRKLYFMFFSINGEDIRLMLWDTAGQEEFDAITKAYYRGMINLRILYTIIFSYYIQQRI